MQVSTLLKPFFAFRFISLCGIAIALWLYSLQNEKHPISAYLTGQDVYLIAFLIVVGFHLTLWLIVEKASLYDLKGLLGRIIRDTVIINIVMLCSIGALFLVNTFFLA